jgi:hypothetical protein
MTRPKSVVKEWLAEHCSWKMQTVLLASFRGCDGLPKQDPSKAFTKRMRATLLHNADPNSTFYGGGAVLDDEGRAPIDDFFIDCSRGSMDAYPVHWLLHLLQAAEIVAYKCPDERAARYWQYFYLTGVKAMHLNPETRAELDARLEDNTYD